MSDCFKRKIACPDCGRNFNTVVKSVNGRFVTKHVVCTCGRMILMCALCEKRGCKACFAGSDWVGRKADKHEELPKEQPESNANSHNIGNSDYSKHSIQPWDIVVMYGLNFFEGNILKYLLRKKGDRLEDLEKIKHYAEKYIEVVKTQAQLEVDKATKRAEKAIKNHNKKN